MRKKKTTAKLVDDLAVLLQKLVRLKAGKDTHGWYNCITCQALTHWKKGDGAHYISRTYSFTKVLEENIHASCKRCNLVDDVYVRDAYNEYMWDTYGKAYIEDLKIRAKKPYKHDRIETEERIKEVRKQIKELESI